MEDNCVFCKIIKGEIPSSKIYEDAEYLAFLDISQFTEGHTLVIPKKHYSNMWEVDDVGSYFNVVQKIGKHYKQLGFKYVDVFVFGRLVPHAHVHLLPHNNDNAKYNAVLQGLENTANHLSTDQALQLVSKLRL